jgi:small subunit ribosomal protein S17
MGGAMAFTGIVTKVGAMNKTATVTVPRFVIHKRTGKVCYNPACA